MADLFLALGRADLDAQRTTGAVLQIDLQGIANIRKTACINRRRLKRFRCFLQAILMIELGADDTVRTDHAAIATLDADFRFPDRHEVGNIALFPLGGGAGVGAIDRQGANRQFIAAPGHHHGRHIAHEFWGIGWHRRR